MAASCSAALLLTAGLGTRLDPLTRLVAKPAVPLGGGTWSSTSSPGSARRASGRPSSNLHHLPSTMTSVLGDGAHLGLRCGIRGRRRSSGRRAARAAPCPLLESDPFLDRQRRHALCDFDVAPMLAAHAASGADVTMAVVPQPGAGHYNGISRATTASVTGVRSARAQRRRQLALRRRAGRGKTRVFGARGRRSRPKRCRVCIGI